MPQLFLRPQYVSFLEHLYVGLIPNPSGQLAELIVYIISIELIRIVTRSYLWWHMKYAQHAAHNNSKFEKMGLFRHHQWNHNQEILQICKGLSKWYGLQLYENPGYHINGPMHDCDISSADVLSHQHVVQRPAAELFMKQYHFLILGVQGKKTKQITSML